LPQPTGYWPFPFPAENRTQFPAKTDVERAIKYKKKSYSEKSQNIVYYQ
ncbi:unnamed protein product, partial [Brassica oleracea var. botrytis]